MSKSRKYLKFGGFFLVLFLGLMLLLSWHNDIPSEVLNEKYLTPHSKFLSVANTKVHYQDKGSGPVLLLLHGTASSSHTWKNWMDLLSNDFRVIAPDLPGFGLTGPRADSKYAVDDMVAFIHDFTEKLGIDSLYLAKKCY